MRSVAGVATWWRFVTSHYFPFPRYRAPVTASAGKTYLLVNKGAEVLPLTSHGLWESPAPMLVGFKAYLALQRYAVWAAPSH